VREAIIAELEREHYARKLTNADVAVIIAAVADTKFHETYDYILASVGPHLAAAITVLETFARPDGMVTPQKCNVCHSAGEPSYVQASDSHASVAQHTSERAMFREMVALRSSAQIRTLAEHLRSLQRLHSDGHWEAPRSACNGR
jgi:hypothetical protein